MRRLGLLTWPEMVRAYQDIGYNLDKATKLSTFTDSLQVEEEAELTKADVLDGYKRRLLTEEETMSFLKTMGFPEATAHFYMARIEMIVEAEKKKQIIANVGTRFKKGVIDENEARRRLAEINVPTPEVDEQILIWEGSRGEEVYTPPIGDLKSFFKLSVISENQFREELAKKGTAAGYIDWYVTALKKGLGE